MKIANHEIGSVGFGLMSFGFLPPGEVEKLAFPAMKRALNAGCTYWNGGEFYGKIGGPNSLSLLAAYFQKYPEDAPKITVSIKSCMNAHMGVDASSEGVRTAVDRCLQLLPPSIKKIDIFESARVDPNVPIEETMKTLLELVKEGKIGGIGISEASAASIRRAAAVAPIAAVEAELSMFETRNLQNGVVDVCGELGIPLVAYSPLGQGFLAGRFKSPSDMAPNDPRRRFPRYSEEDFPKNLEVVDKVRTVADKKGCTPGQLSLAWVRNFSGKPGKPPVVLPLPGASTEERVAENCVVVDVTSQDTAEIDAMLKDLAASGQRYPAQIMHLVEGHSK